MHPRPPPPSLSHSREQLPATPRARPPRTTTHPAACGPPEYRPISSPDFICNRSLVALSISHHSPWTFIFSTATLSVASLTPSRVALPLWMIIQPRALLLAGPRRLAIIMIRFPLVCLLCSAIVFLDPKSVIRIHVGTSMRRARGTVQVSLPSSLGGISRGLKAYRLEVVLFSRLSQLENIHRSRVQAMDEF